MNSIKLSRSDSFVKQILAASFPNWRGRKIRMVVADRPINTRSFWDGGSRDFFTFVDLATLRAASMPVQSPFDRKIAGAECVTLPDGFVCVEQSMFCGKDGGITIHVPASNVAKLLREVEVA